MDRHRQIVARITLITALTALFVCTAVAQENTDGTKIAVVSLVRVQSEYQMLHAQEEGLKRWLESRRSYHDQLTNFVFLPNKEFEEALELMQKTPPLSEEDQARLDELRRISDKNDERFCALRAKTDRTAEETAEFNALQDMYDASAEKLKGVQQSIMEELGTRRQSALSGLMDTVQQAIEATAKEGGYEVVLDADMVFFGGEDITDAVLEHLNDEITGDQADGEGADGEQADNGQADNGQGEQGGGEGGEETGEQGE